MTPISPPGSQRVAERLSQDIGDQPTDPFHHEYGHESQPIWGSTPESSSTEYKSEMPDSIHDHAHADAYVPKLWDSIWLRTRSLAGFLVLFIVLFLVTIVFYAFSQKNQGLSAEDATRQYAWRYGPTAFLTVVLSLWIQLDYSNKILTPWREMRQGDTTADRSLMLDYISPPMITVLWRATKRRHWAVMASIQGILLIQLATVFSTGLFVLKPTILEKHDVPVTVESTFDGDDFHLTNVSSSIGTAPTILYYGTRVHGLTPPPGVDTSRGLVVPDFAPSTDLTRFDGANYTTTVTGAQASLDCEYLPAITNATATSLPWWSILSTFFVLDINTPSCNISRIIVGRGPDHNIYHQPSASQAYQGYFGDYICDPDINYSYYELPDPSNTTVEHRIVMTMVDLRFSPWDFSRNGPSYFYINEITVAVCKSGYTMGNYDVTYTSNGTDGQSKSWTANKVSDSSSTIPGFSSTQLGAAVQSSLDEAYLGTGGQDWVLSAQVPSFYQVLSAMNGNVSIGYFMDPQRLISSATEAFNGIAAELIHKHMTKPSNQTVSGSLRYSQDRLWVRALSVGFMGAAFLLLAGASVVLLIFRPRNVVPSDPGSIGATALILAESSALRSLLSGLGAARSSQIGHKLSSYRFQSVITAGAQPTFIVLPSEAEEPPDYQKTPGDNTSQPEHWWVPSSVKWWFQLMAIFLPIVVIAVLEVIQRLSDQNNGFVDLDSHGFATTHGFSTYIPAVVAFIIASMFASIQLAVCILAPWLALDKGSAPASRSLFLNLTHRLAPHRMFLAFKHGNLGEILIMTATFLTAWLPILVSGLYISVSSTTSETVSFAQSDIFDLKLNNLFYEDNLAGTIAGLIAFNDLPYPKWTYGDLVFSTLNETSVPENIASGTEVPFVATLQATRPSLSCTVTPHKTANWDSKAEQRGQVDHDQVALNLTSVVPWGCAKPMGNITSLPWQQGFALPKDGSSIYFGGAAVLSWTNTVLVGNRAITTDFNRAGGVGYTPEAVANWVGGYGCPSFAVTLGRGSAVKKVSRNTTTYDFDIEVTSILCTQRIEVVDANVTLTLPSLGVIPQDTPPVPDESTAKYLINKLSHYTGPIFEFPLNNLLLTLAYGVGNTTVSAPDGSSGDKNQLDAFTEFIATSNASSPINSLIGQENTQNLIDATNRLYKTYMPQAIDRNMRTKNLEADVATPDAVAAKVKPLNFTTRPDFPRLRLKQEAAPKIAIQVLLGVAVVCAVIGRVLLRGMDRLVPHNPCSIAGRAALFADGEVSTRRLVPYGAEWRSEAELMKMGVWEGWLFSLGWWESSGVYKYGVDIGWIDRGKMRYE